MNSPHPEMVTLTEIARRAVERGWATTMTRQRVSQLSATDPNWPVPASEWRRVGRYWQIPWDVRLETYLASREERPGPKGWATPEKPATGTPADGSDSR